MNEDTFNMQLRKFLKKVGITSQREIDAAVRSALAAGKLNGSEILTATITLQIPALELQVDISDKIALE